MKKILVGVAMSACALSAAAFDGLWNPERGFARPVNPRTVWFVRVVGGRRLALLPAAVRQNDIYADGLL